MRQYMTARARIAIIRTSPALQQLRMHTDCVTGHLTNAVRCFHFSGITRACSFPEPSTLTVWKNIDEQTLEAQTKGILKMPVGKWSRKDFSLVRCLRERWLERKSPEWSILILERCLEEKLANKSELWLKNGDELLQHFHRVLHIIRSADPQMYESHLEALRLLERVQTVSHITGDLSLNASDRAYAMIFEILADTPNKETLDVIEQLIQRRLQQWTYSPDLMFWNSCLHAISKCSPHHIDAPYRAEAVLQRMNIPPDTRSWVTLLHAWARSPCENGAHRAQTILDKLCDSKVENAACFNVCIDAWAQRGRGEDAERLLNRLLCYNGSNQSDVCADQFSFLAAINAWGKSEEREKAATRAEVLFLKMRDKYDAGAVILRPTQQIFASLLKTIARCLNFGSKAESLLNQMESLGERGDPGAVLCNTKAYNAVLLAWTNTRNQDDAPTRALALVRRMEYLFEKGRREVEPTTTTYTLLIKVWSKSRDKLAPQQAIEVLDHMWNLYKCGFDTKPNVITYNTVLSIMARHGNPTQAKKVLEEMETHNILPDDTSYASLILSYGNQHRHNAIFEAEEVLENMNTKFGVAPSTKMFNTVLHLWAKSNEAIAPEKAEALFNRLSTVHQSSLQPDIDSYRFLVDCWAYSDRPLATTRITEILVKMEKQGLTTHDLLVRLQRDRGAKLNIMSQ